jgi:hypothetical protein
VMVLWRGLRWLPDELVDQVDPFVDRCLKLKHKMMEAVLAFYRDMYKDKQQESEQSKISSFFTNSSLPPPPTLFSHHGNFQPGTPTSFQSIPTRIFSP